MISRTLKDLVKPVRTSHRSSFLERDKGHSSKMIDGIAVLPSHSQGKRTILFAVALSLPTIVIISPELFMEVVDPGHQQASGCDQQTWTL